MAILDWLGRLVTPKTLATPQSDAAPMLSIEVPSHPGRGLTPVQLAGILQQAEQGWLWAQAALFMDMEEKDGHIFAEMHKRKMAVKCLDWRLLAPRNPSAKERKATAALEEMIKDAWEKNHPVFDALDAIGHGYSCLELEWRQEGGVWLPAAHHRPPTWFLSPLNDRNALRLRNPSATDGEPLQPFGWIVHIHKSRSGYVGRSGLMRTLAWPYLWKNYSVQDLAEFLETYGMPLRLGKYPVGASDQQKTALMQAVISIGHSAGGIIPQGMELDYKTAMGSGSADGFKLMIDWCESVQSKAILGGTLTSQTGAHGNRSLGDIHNEVRLDIRNDDAIQLAGTLTRDFVYPLAVLNGLFEPGRVPRFQFDTIEAEDLALYADAIPKLTAVDMKIPERYLHEKLKIPEPEEGEPILSGGSGAAGGPVPVDPAAALSARLACCGADAPSPFPDQQALDAALDAWTDENLQGQMKSLIQPLLAAAQNHPEQLLGMLADRYPDMDDAALQERLARVLFVGQLWGRLNGG